MQQHFPALREAYACAFPALSSPYHPGTSIHCPASLTGMYFRILFIIAPYYSMDPDLHTSLHTLSHPRLSLFSYSEIYRFAFLTFLLEEIPLDATPLPLDHYVHS